MARVLPKSIADNHTQAEEKAAATLHPLRAGPIVKTQQPFRLPGFLSQKVMPALEGSSPLKAFRSCRESHGLRRRPRGGFRRRLKKTAAQGTGGARRGDALSQEPGQAVRRSQGQRPQNNPPAAVGAAGEQLPNLFPDGPLAL